MRATVLIKMSKIINLINKYDGYLKNISASPGQ